MKTTNDYFKYGIANAVYKIINGADTLKEARELERKEYQDEETHIARLDTRYGTVEKWLS